MKGVHTGEFFVIAPTDKRIEAHQVQFERAANGKMIKHWRVSDDLGMMRQLGQAKYA